MNRQINPLSVLFGFNAEWTHRRSQIGLQGKEGLTTITIPSSFQARSLHAVLDIYKII